MTVVAFRINAFGYQRYAPGAFDQWKGERLDVELPDGRASGLLLDARSLDDGRAVQLTMECDEATARRLGVLGLDPGGYSLGFSGSVGRPWLGIEVNDRG